jgi:UDP-N-acetylmuramate: L-alanyl-gamma-D-glutamyl-meso-diaminopimelate ligase
VAGNDSLNVYRDFAHAPSKVRASINAVKEQFPRKKLVAILELHTYSSLNGDFMTEYKGAMEQADTAVVYYSRHALEVKKMPELSTRKVYEGFSKEGLIVINETSELQQWLSRQDFTGSNLLLMSSGNYDGLDMVTFARKLVQTSKEEL